MKPAIIIAIVVAALIALNRLGLWAERRGWIYWRQSTRKANGGGSALLGIGSVFDPGVQHMVEVQEAEPMEETSNDDQIPRGRGSLPTRES